MNPENFENKLSESNPIHSQQGDSFYNADKADSKKPTFLPPVENNSLPTLPVVGNKQNLKPKKRKFLKTLSVLAFSIIFLFFLFKLCGYTYSLGLVEGVNQISNFQSINNLSYVNLNGSIEMQHVCKSCANIMGVPQ